MLKIPCYTFHDGFGTYNHLLDGVLPDKTQSDFSRIRYNSYKIYRACIGWIRYKPLLLYITRREAYAEIIRDMRSKLIETVHKNMRFFWQ